MHKNTFICGVGGNYFEPLQMKYYRLVGCIYIPDIMPTDWAYILPFIQISVFGIDMHLSILSLSYFI